MFELFDAPSIPIGDCIRFNMPIELETFKRTSEDGRQIYVMTIIDF